jgi:hypothetical protein
MLQTQHHYNYIQDAGHGWLQVPREELNTLGILGDISSYSYQKLDDNGSNDMVYLEEDCDMYCYIIARKQAGWEAIVIVDILIRAGEADVRNYRNFILTEAECTNALVRYRR